MKRNISIWILGWLLLALSQAVQAGDVLNPFTQRPVSTDTILDNLLRFAPSYEKIVSEYRAELYIKGELHVKKKNALFRYIPVTFRAQKGVRDYLTESYSYLHYTAPNTYDHKVLGSIGTASGGRFEGMAIEYFHVNVYSSSLLFDRLLSPLAANGRKYYHYQVDSVMGTPNDVQYKVRFRPLTKSDQLVAGYMVVSANVWSVREIRFSGRSELMLFENHIKMGEVGGYDEFLPVYYELSERFSFFGNVVDGSYTASLNYLSISTDPTRIRKRKHSHDLSDSYALSTTDDGTYRTDSLYFEQVRPVPLTESQQKLYHDYAYRQDTTRVVPVKKSKVFWGQVGDVLLSHYNVNLPSVGSVRCSPLFNPFLMSYSASNGISYRQSFKYNRLFANDRVLRVEPRMGYNFTKKEFYWALNLGLDYWPQKRGTFQVEFGNGNRIYSSAVLDQLKAIPDSVFDFNEIHLDYFKDFFFNFQHRIEVVNGLELGVGLSAHRRTPARSSNLVVIKPGLGVNEQELAGKIQDAYISVAPRVQVKWTPGLYYYMNGNRKINLRSPYPTFSVDWERGLKGVFGSTGQYERWEFDVQHTIPLGLMRNLYYRVGGGAFTNQEEMYFVDFANFSRNHLPVGWNDDIGGVFQLLDGRWYNSSRKYLRGHVTYEAPFLLLPHLLKYTRYVNNERLYASALVMPHLQPYLEVGYGIGTHAFDVGIFLGSENWRYTRIGCKFTFELFNR